MKPKILSIALTSTTVLLLGLVTPNATSLAQSPPPANNPIVIENQKPGGTGWQYVSGATLADDVHKQIKGYASATSVTQGSSIDFKITVTPVQTFTIQIWRLGYYAGKGGRLVQTVGPLTGVQQPDCPMDPVTGLRECSWSTSYTLNVPTGDTNWTTGIYLAQLINAQNYYNSLMFVVRNDGRIADLLYEQPVMTYQAYNDYPNDGTTGKSLYDYNSYGKKTIAGSTRAVKVSFNRPYADDGLSRLTLGDYGWEPYFIHWVEKKGYDVSYSTSLDTHESAAQLLKYKGFMTVGHDEYWTSEMYDNVAAARDHGTDLAFFSADNAYWHSRLEAAADNTPDRTLVVYEIASIDPEKDFFKKTIAFRDQGRAEQQLNGVQYASYNNANKNPPLVVTNTTTWVYSGTGLVDGSKIRRLTGYEVDNLDPSYPGPISTTFTTLARSPFTDIYNHKLLQQSSLYVAPSGACVFGAGTISWSWALDRAGLVNPGIQKATQNLLDTFISGCGTPGRPIAPPPLATTPVVPDFQAPSAPEETLPPVPTPGVPAEQPAP